MGTRRRFAAAWADAAGFFALSGTNGGHGRQPGQCAPPGAGWPFKEQGMRKPPPVDAGGEPLFRLGISGKREKAGGRRRAGHPVKAHGGPCPFLKYDYSFS